MQSDNISCGSIGKEGGMALAEGLLDNKSLQKLNLRSNSISDEGAVAFATTLKRYCVVAAI